MREGSCMVSKSMKEDEEGGFVVEEDDKCGKSSLVRDLKGEYRHPFLLSLVIGMIGVGAGCSFLVVGIRDAIEDKEREFNKQAEEITRSFETAWQEFVISTLWMHQECHGRNEDSAAIPSIGCSRSRFAAYFEYVTSSQLEPETVIWAANVSHANRPLVEADTRNYYAEHYPNTSYVGFSVASFDAQKGVFEAKPREHAPWYFVQHYLLPAHENALLFADMDVHPNGFPWRYIQAAFQDLKPKVTKRLPKTNQISYFVQIFHPGIQRQRNPDNNGVAVAMVKVYNLLVRAVSSKVENLNVYVYDVTPEQIQLDDNMPQFMSAVSIQATTHQTNDNHPTTARALPIPETDFTTAVQSAKRSHETHIPIEDRTWSVLVTDPHDSYQAPLFAPIFTGLIITIASWITAVWYFTTTVRKAEQQRHQIQAEAEKSALLQIHNRDLNHQVEQRVKQLRQTEQIANEKKREAEQAEARSESMIQTMSMLSHELRTPLQGILGITSMALDELSHSPADIYQESSEDDLSTLGSSSKKTHGTFSTFATSIHSHQSLDSVTRIFSTIHASSQQLLTLINNMLDVRKISVGMMEECELEVIDIAKITDQCFTTLQSLCTMSDVVLNSGPGLAQHKRPLLVNGVELKVQQVLTNLVGNAIKYTVCALEDEPTSIDINVRRSSRKDAHAEAVAAMCTSATNYTEEAVLRFDSDDYYYDHNDNDDDNDNDDQQQHRDVLIVDVRDRGKGIPEDEAHKVFGAFMMLKQHVGKSAGFAQPTGSGLGLQLCTTMIEMMNGYLWANNCNSTNARKALEAAGCDPILDDEGCVFSFYLACPDTVDAEEFMDKSRVVDFLPGDNNNDHHSHQPEDSSHYEVLQHFHIPKQRCKARVLVVDDILINVKVIARMLERLGFRDVRIATSGARALELLEKDPVCDWILTDYQMPGIDGLDFNRKVTEVCTLQNQSTPFMTLCTADYSSTLASRCTDIGINAILRKPITLPDLSRFINEHST